MIYDWIYDIYTLCILIFILYTCVFLFFKRLFVYMACKILDLITAKLFINHHCEYIAINKVSEVTCLKC